MNSKIYPPKTAGKSRRRKRTTSDKGSKRTDRCVEEFIRATHSRGIPLYTFADRCQTPSFEKAETPTMQSKFAASEQNQEQVTKLLIENAQLKCKVHDLENQAQYQQLDLQKLHQLLENTQTELWHLKVGQNPRHITNKIFKYIELTNKSLQHAPRIREIFQYRIPSLSVFAQKATSSIKVNECLTQALQVIWDIAESETSEILRISPSTERSGRKGSQTEFSLKQQIDKVVASTRLQLSSPYSRSNKRLVHDSFNN